MASVDTTKLPSHPTGRAAHLASAHGAEHPLKLYGGWFCPFVQRAWIVLHERRIPHQYVEINPYHKAPEFLALNPRGLVPTLAVPSSSSSSSSTSGGGAAVAAAAAQRPLYESTIICEYLEEAFPPAAGGDEGLLLPTGNGNAYARARCRLWIDHICGKIVPGFYRLLQHTPDKEYTLDEARVNLHRHIITFAREMLDGEREGMNFGSVGGPWFLGGKFSMVDVMLAPWAKRLFLVDHYKPGGLGFPGEGQGGEDEEAWGRWRRWYEAVTTRESVLATWSDNDMYIKAYKRYAEDTTQSEVGQATRKGQKLP